MSERYEYQLLFHPPGVIRVITPAERAAAKPAPRAASPASPVSQRTAHTGESVLSRTTRALRRLAMGWVNAQRQGWI